PRRSSPRAVHRPAAIQLPLPTHAARWARTAAQSDGSGWCDHAALMLVVSWGTCHAVAPAWITSSANDQPFSFSIGRPEITRCTTSAVLSLPSMPPWNPGTTVNGMPSEAGAGALTPVSSGITATWRTCGSEHAISPRNAGAWSTIDRRNGVSGVTDTGDTPPRAHARPLISSAPNSPQPWVPATG